MKSYTKTDLAVAIQLSVPTWDGDLISKTSRDRLVKDGLAIRGQAYTRLSRAGAVFVLMVRVWEHFRLRRLARAHRRALDAVKRLHRLNGKPVTMVIANDATAFLASGQWSVKMENQHVEFTPMPCVGDEDGAL